MKAATWGLLILSLLQPSFGLVNLLLVFCVVVIIHGGLKQGLVAAALAGIIADYLSGLPDGIFLLTYLIAAVAIFYLAGLFSQKKENPMTLMLLVFAATLIYFVLVFVFMLSLKIFEPPSSHLWFQLPGNLIAFYPLQYFYHQLAKLFEKYASKSI